MQQLQMLMQLLSQQQQGPRPQIPNAQAGMPQPPRPQPPPVQAPTAQQAPPGAASQLGQNAATVGATAGATAINPAFGMLAQIIMPMLLQSLFGQKQQQPSAQVIPAPR